MKKFPSLSGRNELQSTHLRRFRVLLLEVDVSQHFFYFLVTHWQIILHLRLHHLDFLLVTGLQTLWNQVIRNKVRERDISMINLLP